MNLSMKKDNKVLKYNGPLNAKVGITRSFRNQMGTLTKEDYKKKKND